MGSEPRHEQASRDKPSRDQPRRDKPWIFRTYAGHSTAAASNALYRTNLSKGQTGLSVAFDLPTQTGYDSDHPLAKGEVGRVGVPICHLGDMRTLFDGIPLGTMNTSMTINATAAWLLALYVALARRTGRRADGPARHDAERHHQGISVARHLRVSAGTIDEADQGRNYESDQGDAEMESDECLLLSLAGGRRDAGAGTGLRTRHRHRRARRRERTGQCKDEDFGDVVGRISIFVNAGLRFITEICKMRAFTRIVGRDHARALRRDATPSSGCSAMAYRSIRWG